MNWIRNERFLCYQNGKTVIFAEIMADSASELPDVDGIEGKIISKGSVALDINTGDLYCLNSSGIWKKQNTASSLGTAQSVLLSSRMVGAPLSGNLIIQEEE